MAHLDTLIAMIPDEKLRSEIQGQVSRLAAKASFGLVFEEHRPETVQLPGFALSRGGKVVFKDGSKPGIWTVLRLAEGVATIVRAGESGERTTADVNDLVVIREFGDPIYPGLQAVDSITRGGDKPFHSLINAENYHALEALLYAYEGRVDAIYADPPYNTGARDWKYNNDYVDGADEYRHSKWLSFMERRLKLAKRLLNPKRSVLIVTIDEKEFLRLGLLLEQMFPEATIQMVSVSINPANVARKGGFGRSDEYYFFVMLGDCSPSRVRLNSDWVSEKGRTFKGIVRWDLLRRSGTNARRVDRPNLFYPIFVNTSTGRITATGSPLGENEDARSIDVPDGHIAAWPMRKDGTEGTWQLGPSALMRHVEEGRVRLGGAAERGYVIYYLKGGEYQKVQNGQYPILGRNADGSLNLGESEETGNYAVPSTQWRIPSHDSTQYGSRLLSQFLPDRRFPFPKSLYAVEDALRFFVQDVPNAIVLDYFGGSGTTTHAVMRLNKQDGGKRRSIVVTNNEVGDEATKRLAAKGLSPGDPEWEAQGIAELVTWPRIRAAVSGVSSTGQAVKGDYKFVDEFSMSEGFEENVEFFKLTYEDNQLVRLGRKFNAIAPILWMRAGAEGSRIDELPEDGWALPKKGYYGILTDIDQWEPFVDAVNARDDVRCVFIVTDSQAEFEAINVQIDQGIDSVRLYSDYLQSFEINTRQG